jgi:hypothetical protein
MHKEELAKEVVPLSKEGDYLYSPSCRELRALKGTVPLWLRMGRVDPVYLVRPLHRLNIKVNNDRLLVIAHDNAGERFVLACINLLMRNKRWHIDEVARPSFDNEFEVLSPPHPRAATDYVDYALQFSVMMRTGFGVRLDRDGTRPQLVCASRGVRNSRRTRHARRLGRIKI